MDDRRRPSEGDPDRRRDTAGWIGWGLLFLVAAVMLVVRLLNGGGC